MRRFKQTRESYIPKKSTKVSDKNSDAIAYISDDIVRGKVLYSVTAFCAKRQKPDLHIYCRSPATREAEVRRYFESRFVAEVERGERGNVSLATVLRLLHEVGVSVRLSSKRCSSDRTPRTGIREGAVEIDFNGADDGAAMNRPR